MSTPWFRRLSDGLSRSRERLGGQLNVLLRRGPDLDEEFWSDLEDTLIGADIGFTATNEIVTRLRRLARRAGASGRRCGRRCACRADRCRVSRRCRGPALLSLR